MHGQQRLVAEDPHQVLVPAHFELLADQVCAHRVVALGHLHVAVGVHRARAAFEQRERLARQWLQRLLVGLLVVGEDLAACGAMNAQPRHGAVPVA